MRLREPGNGGVAARLRRSAAALVPRAARLHAWRREQIRSRPRPGGDARADLCAAGALLSRPAEHRGGDLRGRGSQRLARPNGLYLRRPALELCRADRRHQARRRRAPDGRGRSGGPGDPAHARFARPRHGAAGGEGAGRDRHPHLRAAPRRRPRLPRARHRGAVHPGRVRAPGRGRAGA